MSTFAVSARRITLHPIENADRLEVARVDGTEYMAVVQKGLHADGDLIVYIPEQAILPDQIIDEMGLVSAEGKTMLAGGTILPDGTKKRDRVKALRLRGTLSQGLIYSHTAKLGELQEGVDYAEALGVVKYQPPIPTDLDGAVEHCPGLRPYTNLENIKNFPGVFVDGEEVVAVEKCHGTQSNYSLIAGEFVISSKGLAGKQLRLVDERGPDGKYRNAYFRIADRFDLEAKLQQIAGRYPGETISLFGETYGVQELMYGLQKGELGFKAYDIRVGDRYLPFDDFTAVCAELAIPTLPVIYRGPFDRDVIEQAATGPEQTSGRQTHHREGVVVRAVTERHDPQVGRAILKVISWKYLAKKGEDGTEYE